MARSLSETSTTFLNRLGKQEPKAWQDFATRYSWMMRRWLKSWKIPNEDIDDLIQDACLRVFSNVHNFRRRGHGSFRAWLKELSRSCWLQAVRKTAYRQRMQHNQLDLHYLLSEETLYMIDTQIDLLIEQDLFEYAIARTRQLCNDTTWNAYRLFVIDGRTGLDVADTLGISVNLVYQCKKRFEDTLEQEWKSIAERE